MISTRSKMAGSLLVLFMLMMVLYGHETTFAVQSDPEVMATKTRFSYVMGPGDTPEIGRALAIYGAKYNATLWLAAKLADKGLLKNFADRQMEIYCLVADELTSTVVDESFDPTVGRYAIEIEIRGSLADFVKAEIKNAQFEKEENTFSLQEEMEPALKSALMPGQELSRAYRYIRNEHWRKAIIYLDQLQIKYPNWGELFYAKGLGFEGMRENQQSLRAHGKACERGHQQACAKIKTLAAED